MIVPAGDSVSYPVKDLLQRIDDKLDAVVKKLDAKADHRDLERLEERVTKLELQGAGLAAIGSLGRWLVGTVAVGMLGSVATLVWLASGGH